MELNINNSTEQPLATPTNMPPSVSEPRQLPKKNRTVAIGVLLLIVILAIMWLVFGRATSPAPRPTLTVGSQPYIYACSVFSADTLAQALALDNDKNKQSSEETYAFAPFDTKAKQLDILQQTDRTNIPSTCRIKLDIRTAQSDIAPTYVSATIQQYANEQDAQKEYNQLKTQAGSSSTLPSFTDNSFYTPPVAVDDTATVQRVKQVALYKNTIISYSVPVKEDDAIGQKAATQMDKVHKDVVKRIAAGEGSQAKNYNAITKIGSHPFFDVCQNTDFGKVSKALNSHAEFDLTLFTSSQQYAPTSETSRVPSYVLSVCNSYFRTQEEGEAQHKLPKEQTKANDFVAYPHQFLVQVLTTKNSADAQKLVSEFKKSGDEPAAKDSGITINDITLGDKAIKVFSPASKSNPIDGYLQYIAKDNHVYVISILMTKQTEPYKTTTSKITDEQMERIYESLTEAAARVEK